MRRFLLFALMLTTLASAHPPTHPPAEAGPEAERFACVPVNGRQGQPGCWIIASMPVVAAVGRPLFWHVYELPAETPAGMREAEGGRIVQAYGRTWLVTVADREWRPAAGRHVATVGPLLPLTSGPHLASFAEATFAPGMRSRIHTHPGPEAWVVLEGEQCLETPEGVIRVAAGQDMMVRGGIPMALFGTGTGTRRALVLVLHPADQPWGMPHTGWQPTGACLTP